jgi:hypothetical protein
MVAATLDGRPRPDALPASAIWHEVRDRLRPFTDAAPRAIDERDLGMWAQRTHLELRRAFGLPEKLRLADEHKPDLTVDTVRHLQAMVNEIPDVGDHLAEAIKQMADRGELHALASKLPFREYRVSEFLTRKPVVADRYDVMTVLHRLESAGQLAASLAVDLDRAASATVGRQQRGLLAAHEARVDAARLDPHTALVQQVADEMLGITQETQAPAGETDHRADMDDAESVSQPEWEIE